MTLTPEQIEELKQVSKPLVRWLQQNCHPHVTVIVDCKSLEIVEGLATVKYELGI